MFKYGSFRSFVIKSTFGIIFSFFAVVYLGSLYSYSSNDPGFNMALDNQEYIISNYFGLFGANLSSYSIVLIGTLSFVIGIFLLIEGIKLAVGFKNKLITLKVFAHFVGIILINVFISNYNIESFNTGLVPQFIYSYISELIILFTTNSAVINIIYFLLFLLGVFLINFSFSIKLNYYLKILNTFRILKYFKYFYLIFSIFRYIKIKPKVKYKKLKNEPTIRRGDNHSFKKTFVKEKNTYKQKQFHVDGFKFTLPDNGLLIKQHIKSGLSKELNKINNDLALKLERTLSEYGVEGRVTGFKSGPIVTLFEFIPNAGIKSSKVIGLSDDIARAMSSISARISSQPGKTSLGIEIPNNKREDVFFGDLIEDARFINNETSLTLALGKDISGEKIYTDLEKMPHLLIAGTTGSGKSVGINTMILSLLFKFKPNECKLILIDPKMLELSVYEDIPHLLTPVVTDPKKSVFALKWVVREMENRYKLMSSLNVKNITSYNNKVLKTISSGRKLFREVQTGIDPDTKIPIIEKQEIPLEKMPFIVVVIDEMADLMMVAGKEVESLVQRLAQMARASGIHLITATQRPSVDVITGTIKANFPSRISYKVASKFDSRTILNEMGAEQLLGSGDMLLLENAGMIKRLHGGFVSENEVERVVNYIKSQATFDYKKEISLNEFSDGQNNNFDLVSDNNTDELYTKAVEIVVKQQKVSTSYIQRYLQIGYNRAARIVEKMEEDGIITEANNAGKRDVIKKN